MSVNLCKIAGGGGHLVVHGPSVEADPEKALSLVVTDTEDLFSWSESRHGSMGEAIPEPMPILFWLWWIYSGIVLVCQYIIHIRMPIGLEMGKIYWLLYFFCFVFYISVSPFPPKDLRAAYMPHPHFILATISSGWWGAALVLTEKEGERARHGKCGLVVHGSRSVRLDSLPCTTLSQAPCTSLFPAGSQ